MGGRNWTQKEKDYLEDNWGLIATKTIASKLNRTVKSIKHQAERMNLGEVWNNTDGIPLRDVADLVGKTPNAIYCTWIGRYGLKTTKIHYCLKVVSDKELARFMREHLNLWTPSKCDSVYFGEYEWFNRALDEERQQTIKSARTKWNQGDTEMLNTLRRRGLTFKEISKKLNRTESSCYFRWKKIYGKSRNNTCNK